MTARAIFFLEGDRRIINRLELTTGKISTVATVKKPGGAVTVSPDEAFIVWQQSDRTSQDLMLVENFR